MKKHLVSLRSSVAIPVSKSITEAPLNGTTRAIRTVGQEHSSVLMGTLEDIGTRGMRRMVVEEINGMDIVPVVMLLSESNIDAVAQL